MKKRFLAIITFILAIVMSMGMLSGCKLITVDEEKDMNQVIATVKVYDDAKTDNIYKRDLVFSYMTEGYLYTQYYGYSAGQAMNAVLNSLISNKIVLQTIMKNYADKNGVACTYNVKDYLTDDEKTQAMYEVYSNLNDLLESYLDDKPEYLSDTFGGKTRAVPSNVKTEEEEKEELTELDISTTERRLAYDKLIKFLDANGLLGKNYKGKIEETAYYTELVNGFYGNALLDKYEKEFKKNKRESYNFDALSTKYLDDKNAQEKFSATDFADALTNATMGAPVFYGAYNNYGYVYNLLLGVNDAQSSDISAISSKEGAEKVALRNEILKSTTASDLRASWIIGSDNSKNFDYDESNKTVTFKNGYSFFENGIPYQGIVNKVESGSEDIPDAYSIKETFTFALDDFIKDFINKDLYNNEARTGVEKVYDNANENVKFDYSEVVYEYYASEAVIDGFDAKINDLIFAFSTDDGSLNKYKGYVISPNNAANFVADFATAGRWLLEKGGTSYIVVASDFGYHIMFFSQKFESGVGFSELTDYLDTFGLPTGYASWEEYYNYLRDNWDNEEVELDKDSFLYLYADSFFTSKVDNEYSKDREKIINSVMGDKSKVKIYSDRFSDLLG